MRALRRPASPLQQAQHQPNLPDDDCRGLTEDPTQREAPRQGLAIAARTTRRATGTVKNAPLRFADFRVFSSSSSVRLPYGSRFLVVNQQRAKVCSHCSWVLWQSPAGHPHPPTMLGETCPPPDVLQCAAAPHTAYSIIRSKRGGNSNCLLQSPADLCSFRRFLVDH